MQRLFKVERVLHVARGVIRGHVERFEVVVVVFDLGSLEHLVAEAREDLDHFIANEAERVPVAELRHTAGQRDVDGICRAARGSELLFELGERGLDLFLQIVGGLAERLLLVGSGGLERLHEGGGPAVAAAEPAGAQRLQRGIRTHLGQFGAEQLPRLVWTDRWVDAHHAAAALAFSASLLNAAGSRAASSARLLRSSSMPACFRPSMNLE